MTIWSTRPSLTTVRASASNRFDWWRFELALEREPTDGLQRLGSSYGGYVVPADQPTS